MITISIYNPTLTVYYTSW